MNPIRLLVVSTRYWPHCDDSVSRLQTLLEGLRRSGVVPTVVAARFATSWSEEIYHREIRVLRPAVGPRGEWSRSRYHRSLAKWIREHAHQFDLVYVDGMRQEAAVAIDTCRRLPLPVVVRCTGSGKSSDISRWQYARRGPRTRESCLVANSLIVAGANSQQQLIGAGAKPTSVVRIDDGFPPLKRPTASARAELRRSLADINPDLFAAQSEIVVMSSCRLDNDSGARLFAHAGCRLAADNPTLRFWLTGDGALREQLYDDIKHAGARTSVLMPGSFANPSAVMAAANLFVLPCDGYGLEHHLPAAVSLGLPVVAADTPTVRAMLPAQCSSFRFFKPGSVDSLSSCIQQAVAQLDELSAASERCRKSALAARPLDRNVATHAKLFYSILARRQTAGVAS